MEVWLAQPICQSEGFQLTLADGMTIFMTGSPQTRDSWHGGALLNTSGHDIPLGASGRILRPGVWTSYVPFGGGQCQLLMELSESVSVHVSTPYVRIHPLFCDPSLQVGMRRETVSTSTYSTAQAASMDFGQNLHPSMKAGNEAKELPKRKRRQELPKRKRGQVVAVEALNISGPINVADTSPLYDFTVGGNIVASYATFTVPAALGLQYWLIKPVQARYIGELLQPHPRLLPCMPLAEFDFLGYIIFVVIYIHSHLAWCHILLLTTSLS